MPKLRKINQDNLREHNLSIVMQTLLSAGHPMSRADFAKSTGLTKAAMSMLSEILIRNNVFCQLTPVADSTYGRPSTPLSFCSRHWAGIGLQVDTSGYGFTVLDLAGGSVHTEWVSAAMVDVTPEDIFSKLDRMIQPVERELKALGYTVCGAGLAVPGLVKDRSVLLGARNLGWKDVDLRRFDVVSRLNAIAVNEADVAAVAQIPGYAAAPIASPAMLDTESSFIYLSTDVGISGAVVSQGKVMEGEHHFAGEIGHLSVDWNGPQCPCGRRGCLEQYAGRRALVEAAGIATGAESASMDSVNRLLSAWHARDERAVKAINRGLAAMASGLCSAVNLLDIHTIVLGGFWTNFTDTVAKKLEKRIQGHALGRDAMDISVLVAPVPDHPALRGAATVGLRELIDHPMRFIHT